MLSLLLFFLAAFFSLILLAVFAASFPAGTDMETIDELELTSLLPRHLGIIMGSHLEPGMLEHFLSSGAVFRLPLENLEEKV